MKQPEIKIDINVNNYISREKDYLQFYEIGQLRRARMHAARLINAIDDKKALTPALHQLLETSLVLETTDSRILAAYLKQSPTMIRAEFQSIRTILGKQWDIQ